MTWFCWGDALQAQDLHRENGVPPQNLSKKMKHYRWALVSICNWRWQLCCSKICWPCLQSAGPAVAQWCWSFKCFDSSKLGLLRERRRDRDRDVPGAGHAVAEGRQKCRAARQRGPLLNSWFARLKACTKAQGYVRPFPTAHHLINRICFQLHQLSSCQAKAAGVHPFTVTACGDWRGSAMSPNELATQTQTCPESVCSAKFSHSAQQSSTIGGSKI